MFRNAICVVIFLLLMDLKVISNKPVYEEEKVTPTHNQNNDLSSTKSLLNILYGPSEIIEPETDTSKHYRLFKIKEYYDFLPFSWLENDRHFEDKLLRLEIEDMGNPDVFNINLKRIDPESTKNLVKSHSKRSLDNVFLYGKALVKESYVKRDIHDFLNEEIGDDVPKLLVRRDLGDGLPASPQLLDDFSDVCDTESPGNNNFRTAYVPFFKINKYFIRKWRLDDI
ncbi:hypothetical protein GWI33_019887 [Rhynchophorus ferrugineus]|uniref:Uncharacterized protein n=1 Tax=Rhynchophorus ferrugineus TaxID=354439 RepID=A0A834M6I9_RHYFE|nr:hypothetical protein GWI33_019887 [Rhynchophorus ferrugineus]